MKHIKHSMEVDFENLFYTNERCSSLSATKSLEIVRSFIPTTISGKKTSLKLRDWLIASVLESPAYKLKKLHEQNRNNYSQSSAKSNCNAFPNIVSGMRPAELYPKRGQNRLEVN